MVDGAEPPVLLPQRRPQSGLAAPARGGVGDRGEDHRTAVLGLDRTERDLDRKLRAVAAQRQERAPCAQATRPRPPQKAGVEPAVDAAAPLGHEHFHAPAEKFGARVAEQPLGLGIDQRDAARGTDQDEGAGRGFDDDAQNRCAVAEGTLRTLVKAVRDGAAFWRPAQIRLAATRETLEKKQANPVILAGAGSPQRNAGVNCGNYSEAACDPPHSSTAAFGSATRRGEASLTIRAFGRSGRAGKAAAGLSRLTLRAGGRRRSGPSCARSAGDFRAPGADLGAPAPAFPNRLSGALPMLATPKAESRSRQFDAFAWRIGKGSRLSIATSAVGAGSPRRRRPTDAPQTVIAVTKQGSPPTSCFVLRPAFPPRPASLLPASDGSGDRGQPARETAPGLDVMGGRPSQPQNRILVEGPDRLGRRADDQRIIGKSLALGDQRAGADEAAAPMFAPLRMIAPMPISEPSPIVQPCRMRCGRSCSPRRRQGKAEVGVQRRAFLDVASARRSRSARCRRAAPRRTRRRHPRRARHRRSRAAFGAIQKRPAGGRTGLTPSSA